MLELVKSGGPVMIPIIVLSVLALGLIIERVVAFLRVREPRTDLLPWVLGELGKGRGTVLAEELARSPSPEAAVLREGVLARSTAPGERELRMEAKAQKELARLERFLPWLSSLASVETMLGLLGTVTGMIRSFLALRLSGSRRSRGARGRHLRGAHHHRGGAHGGYSVPHHLPRPDPGRGPDHRARRDRGHRPAALLRPAGVPPVKLPRRRRDEGGILMTPLIDMVFLTLLFFMVNAVLAINPAIRVDLPRARSSLGAVGRDVVVTVTADGGIFIDDRRVDDAGFAVELRAALAREGTSSVLLQADKSLAYERLVEVMDQAKIAGTGRISLATVRSGGR